MVSKLTYLVVLQCVIFKLTLCRTDEVHRRLAALLIQERSELSSDPDADSRRLRRNTPDVSLQRKVTSRVGRDRRRGFNITGQTLDDGEIITSPPPTTVDDHHITPSPAPPREEFSACQLVNKSVLVQETGYIATTVIIGVCEGFCRTEVQPSAKYPFYSRNSSSCQTQSAEPIQVILRCSRRWWKRNSEPGHCPSTDLTRQRLSVPLPSAQSCTCRKCWVRVDDKVSEPTIAFTTKG